MSAASGSVLDRPGIDPRIRARRIEVARSAGRRRLLRLLELGLLVAVAAGFAVAVRSPLLDVDEIRIAAGEHTGTRQVLRASGIAPGDQLLDIDLRAAGAQVAALPWVERVQLHRDIGGVVSIRVVERQPAAMVSGPEGPLLVDLAGRVLAPATELPADAPPLVEVTGGPAAPQPGQVLDHALRPAIGLAARLSTAVPGEVAAVVAGDELTATLERGGTVRFGDDSRLDAKLVSLATVLEQVDLQCLATLDLRLPGNPVLTREPTCS